MPYRLMTLAFALSAALTYFVAPHLQASPATTKLPTGFELLVFEAAPCLPCQLFRRDVAPRYAQSLRGETAPLRYIKLTERRALRHPALKMPLSQLPTVVLTEDGREFARVEGYAGPDNFFAMVGRAFADRVGETPRRPAVPGPVTR